MGYGSGGKSKLIVNPAAGSDSAPDHLPAINKRLRDAFGPLDVVMTKGPGDATTLASEAVHDGYHRLFVAGGDGTLNEALNGVAHVRGGLDTMTFGVIPLGTGNDFATALGIPNGIDDALEALVHAEPAHVDVARLNDVSFVNVSAGGFMAEVSDAVTSRMKTLAGKLAYLIGGAEVMLEHKPIQARVAVQDEGGSDVAQELDMQLHTFAICNAPLVGGGRLMAPHARIDDGWLDVCLIQSMPTMEFVALLTRVSSGEHVEDERVMYFRAREIALTFERGVAVNTDGQVLEARTCRYTVTPRATRFLVASRR